ncbi:H-2 class I histocompatibility antigen, Q9 alpha chain-like [Colossoma macropomum]|uniref:H-2 class I histocompatibility antigen, Q9 alpha chain-like n=1 Tax=Colossoma macropomum TaxID=42526 RepID=UPI00186466CB|nr:H-2 class I histocompatibility antigen, Q9 alpha chain-like [Colossoma macropomum]
MKHGNDIMKSLIFLAFTVQLASPATHSLQYFYTGVTPGISFPEFTLVGLVDGEQFMYYDSDIRKMIPKTEWIKSAKDDEPDYWFRNTQRAQGNQEDFKVSLDIAMERYNHTKGVHTVQWMYGCELHDDGTKRGYDMYAYDGEDFLFVDLNTLTWTAPNPKAFITKQKLDATGWEANYAKNYLLNECIEWLKKYMEYGRSTLERKVSPEAFLFQKNSSSPVVCHATGFFPKAVMISWQKNGEDLHEDVELRETLPNQDGTFQKRSVLTVSPEELKENQYSCVVHHSSLKEELVLPFKTGGGSVGIITGAVVAVLLLVLIGCVGVFIWKKKQSGFKPVSGNPNAPSEGDSSSNNS